jgi:hypothetical protein
MKLNSKVGTRKHDKLGRDEVFKIASMYFEQGESPLCIAKSFEVSKGCIYKMIAGDSHIDDWIDALDDLVSRGVKSGRMNKKTDDRSSRKGRGLLPVETVKEVRTRSKNGESQVSIAKAMDLSKPTVRAIVDFKNYTDKKYWV